MTKIKDILNENKGKILKTSLILASVCAMSYIGATYAIKTTRFEIHLFGPDGKSVGYVD